MVQIEQIFPSLTWRLRHETMYPDRAFDLAKLEDDFDGTHFGLYVDHELTGVVSLFQKDDSYQFRKLAILPQAQNQGYGTILLHYVLDFCKIQKAYRIWCNARVNARDFYVKFGFHETGKSFTRNEHDFVVMELKF